MRSASEKRRDMARSILPSTQRRAARDDLASARRRFRRQYRQQLTYATSGPGLDRHLDALDPRAYPDHVIRSLVRRRRGADKLNHFERWAIRITAHLPIEERLGALRSVLPGGLIGAHAMTISSGWTS